MYHKYPFNECIILLIIKNCYTLDFYGKKEYNNAKLLYKLYAAYALGIVYYVCLWCAAQKKEFV